MERLTKRTLTALGSVVYSKCDFSTCNYDCKECSVLDEVEHKLKAYEDAEEQGLLIRIPPPDDSDGMPQRVEVAKVVHAKWYKINDWDDDNNALFECTNCHHGDVHARSVAVPYCWYCGAKMDGKEEGAE